MSTAIVAAFVAATSLSFTYENFTFERGIARITMKVSNEGYSIVRRGYIVCAFLDGDRRTIDIGRAVVSDLAPQAYKYEQVGIVTDRDVQHAECYVDKVVD